MFTDPDRNSPLRYAVLPQVRSVTHELNSRRSAAAIDRYSSHAIHVKSFWRMQRGQHKPLTKFKEKTSSPFLALFIQQQKKNNSMSPNIKRFTFHGAHETWAT